MTRPNRLRLIALLGLSVMAPQVLAAGAEPAPGAALQMASAERQRLESELRRMASQARNRPAANGAPYAAYNEDCMARLAQHLKDNPPAAARGLPLSARLKLAVTVRVNGTVEQVQLLESSGNAELDRAVQVLATKAPFQPFPEALRSKADRIVFPVQLVVPRDRNAAPMRGQHLAITFEQNGSTTTTSASDTITAVELANAPFTITAPADPDATPVMICLTSSDNFYKETSGYNKQHSASCFGSGRGMAADPNGLKDGWDLVAADGKAMNYFPASRTINEADRRSIKARQIRHRNGGPARPGERLYMIVFMDRNKDRAFDPGEYALFTITIGGS